MIAMNLHRCCTGDCYSYLRCIFFCNSCLDFSRRTAGSIKKRLANNYDNILIIFINLLFPCMTKAACISFRNFQFFYLFPYCFFYFLNHHLSNPVTRLNDLFFLRKVD